MWWEATVTAIKQVLYTSQVDPHRIVGIGLTGQMHGLVVMDGKGNALRPCIMWNDQRTSRQCDEINLRVGEKRVIELTGNLVLSGFTAPKLLWVKENEPEIYQKIAKILLPKDYIRYCLSGDYITDVSDASGTSLFNVAQRCWSKEMLGILQIPLKWMPEVVESPVCNAALSQQAAHETGLIAGIPIAGGGGDQAAQALGIGVVEEGMVSATIGTSGVVFAASNTYRVEPNGLLHSFCHAVPGMWHLMGVMLSAGGSLRWFRDTFGEPELTQAMASGKDVYDLLLAEASEVPPGSEGLVFLPYLTGERTPYNDPDARGVFFGLSLRHRKAHLTRAILEGVSFGLYDSLKMITALGINSNEIILTGGGARSELWQRIIADVFDVPLITTTSDEGAAFGAALLAGIGTRLYETPLEAVSRTVKRNKHITPSEHKLLYKEYYQRYNSLYHVVREEFKEVGKLVQKYIDIQPV
jgi:xylulokinase